MYNKIISNKNYDPNETRKGFEPLFKDLQSNTLPIMLPCQNINLISTIQDNKIYKN